MQCQTPSIIHKQTDKKTYLCLFFVCLSLSVCLLNVPYAGFYSPLLSFFRSAKTTLATLVMLQLRSSLTLPRATSLT